MTHNSDCCGRVPRLAVSEYFDRGFRRKRGAALPIIGETICDCGGLRACFSLEVEQLRIAAVSFESTTCVTLVAYCELLAESVPGAWLGDALEIEASDLVWRFPQVPVLKRDRASLATVALHSAIRKAIALHEHRHANWKGVPA